MEVHTALNKLNCTNASKLLFCCRFASTRTRSEATRSYGPRHQPRHHSQPFPVGVVCCDRHCVACLREGGFSGARRVLAGLRFGFKTNLNSTRLSLLPVVCRSFRVVRFRFGDHSAAPTTTDVASCSWEKLIFNLRRFAFKTFHCEP